MNESLSYRSNEEATFKKKPKINVISKEEYEKRVDEVFHLLWETLSRSFGPYGAPTIICNYPFQHVTKDGYTIMKNLSMDASETKVDQSIADLASTICGRLNYSVGDGTTSAVISTNSIYKNYRRMREDLNRRFVLPRDVKTKYEKIKDSVIEKLQEKVIQIRSTDMDELRKNIYDVVYVSSNGNELITNYIADLYKELGSPFISCVKASDGITKKTLINGYKYDLSLNDKLYINNDDGTAKVSNVDVIIFGTKINKDNYTRIIKPLSQECKMRGRKLLVAAPFYDETALGQIIAPELNIEYKKNHDINTILTAYRATNAHTRLLVNDFSVLCNTTVIDRSLESFILAQVDANVPITTIFNIDQRNLNGTRSICIDEAGTARLYTIGEDEKDLARIGCVPFNEEYPLIENHIDLGFVKECALGMKDSMFTDLIYDKDRYEKILADAKMDLAEKEAKYQKLGTFNIEVSQAQARLYALNLKMGIIEVGGDSDMSVALLKDAVDDAVKAAASAYDHGVVLGCNVNLIQVLLQMMLEEKDETNRILLNILLEGFLDVYRTVLSNAFSDTVFEVTSINDGVRAVKEYFDNPVMTIDSDNLFMTESDGHEEESKLYEAVAMVLNNYKNVSIHNVLIYYSILTNQVFDLSKFSFTNTVINSCQTDEEILKATVDLVSLLIIGNQMVVTQKHNFED